MGMCWWWGSSLENRTVSSTSDGSFSGIRSFSSHQLFATGKVSVPVQDRLALNAELLLVPVPCFQHRPSRRSGLRRAERKGSGPWTPNLLRLEPLVAFNRHRIRSSDCHRLLRAARVWKQFNANCRKTDSKQLRGIGRIPLTPGLHSESWVIRPLCI
jgi:hypothetical protein